MRKLLIYCDGGFGNRLNGLVSGLALAEMVGLEPSVIWPRNNWCGAAYGQIFSDKRAVDEGELTEFVVDAAGFRFVMTEDHLRQGVDYVNPLEASSLADINQHIDDHTGDVFYHTPLIPRWIDMQHVMRIVSTLEFAPALWERTHEFLQQHKLKDFIGVHIRKTDFGANASDDEGLFKLLSGAPQLRFFVCSDDPDVEKRFCTLHNVVSYQKRAHVGRRIEGDWNTPTLDHSGRLYACNVERSAISVEDAVIDLLILAYSQILDSSKSTFRNSALLIKTAMQLGIQTTSKAS
jgi:hypothetical protein